MVATAPPPRRLLSRTMGDAMPGATKAPGALPTYGQNYGKPGAGQSAKRQRPNGRPNVSPKALIGGVSRCLVAPLRLLPVSSLWLIRIRPI